MCHTLHNHSSMQQTNNLRQDRETRILSHTKHSFLEKIATFKMNIYKHELYKENTKECNMINNYSVLNNFHIMLSMMIHIDNKDGKASTEVPLKMQSEKYILSLVFIIKQSHHYMHNYDDSHRVHK